MVMILYDDDNNNPLNIEKHDHEDDIINSKYYSLVNGIKNEHISKKC